MNSPNRQKHFYQKCRHILLVFFFAFSVIGVKGQSDSSQLKLAIQYYNQDQLDSASLIYEYLLDAPNPVTRLRAYTALIKINVDRGQFHVADSLVALVKIRQMLSSSNETSALFFMNQARLEEEKSNIPAAFELAHYAVNLASKSKSENSELGSVLQYLSNLHGNVGQADSALFYMHAAYGIQRQIRDTTSIEFANIYNSLAVAYFHAGSYDLAEKYYEKTVELAQSTIGNTSSVLGMALSNWSLIKSHRGENDEAIEMLQKSLMVYLYNKDTLGAASVYRTIGVTKYFQGDYAEALEYVLKCYQIRLQQLGEHHHLVANTEQVLGILYEQSGNYNKSLEFQKKVLQNYIDNFGQVNESVANTYENLALTFRILNEVDSAIHYIEKSHAIFIRLRLGNNTTTSTHYHSLATIYNDAGQYDRALDYAIKSMKVTEEIGLSGSPDYFTAMSLKATIYANMGHRNTAIDLHRTCVQAMKRDDEYLLLPQAVDIVYEYTRFLLQESIIDGNDTTTAATFKSTVEDFIELAENVRKQHVDPYTKKQHALKTNQFYKTLLKHCTTHYNHDPTSYFEELIFKISELSKAAIIRDRLDARVNQYHGVPDSILVQEGHLREELSDFYMSMNEISLSDSLRSRLIELHAQINQQQHSIQTNYPDYYNLRFNSEVLSLQQLRKSDNTFLSYFHDDSLYHAIVIEDTSVHIIPLASVALIDSLTTAWNGSIERLDRSQVNQISHQLYGHIWQPLRPFISNEQVLISPAGRLREINYEALLDEKEEYLIYQHCISYVVSFTSYFHTYHQDRQRTSTDVLSIAPGFEDRMKKAYIERLDSLTWPDSTYLLAVRQPWAIKMAKSIYTNFKGSLLTYDKANEEAARAMLPSAGILNFATHAVLNDDDPMRSKLVLAKTFDDKYDGYLHTYELFAMDLAAQLAIVGACESGVGAEVPGDGLVSLAYSMKFAGCPSAVMTMWSVDEKSNVQIMQSFLDHAAQGQKLNRALRQAKLDFLQSASDFERMPYYWGGSVLMGSIDPIQLQTQTNIWYSAGIGIVALLALLLLWKRSKKASNNS